MSEEGAGTGSPFWPSASNTNTGATIPSDFFMDSKLCGECHKDIYRQWKSSTHHFASFNNRFYRATILHMQELSGTQGSKWCAGCHDHAVFFNGRFDRPIKEQVDTPEAQAGWAACRAIPSCTWLAAWATAISPFFIRRCIASRPATIRICASADAFLTYLNPEPHRRTFLKPFMRLDSPEYLRGLPQGAPGRAGE